MYSNPTIIPVILCGGSGSRLWPLSSVELPKQFLNLVHKDQSLLQKTIERALNLTGATPSSVITVANKTNASVVKSQLEELHSDLSNHIIAEPASKNTAAAIATAAKYAATYFSPDSILFVMPSDAHIENEESLQEALIAAIAAARDDRIVIFGIPPHRPETGYGYIKTGAPLIYGAYELESFVEKPNKETARSYIQSGQYLWNSGMFVCKASAVLNEYQVHAPDILKNIHDYQSMPSRSFDVAILEKSSNVCVVRGDFKWADVGSWLGLWEVLFKDFYGNNAAENVHAHATNNCLIRSGGKKITCIGLQNTVVIETKDQIFVADMHNQDAIRQFVKNLES